MSKNEPVWSVPMAVEDIAETGLHVEIEASTDARSAIAKVAALRELPRLVAAFDLTKQGARVHVAGQVNATVGQTCVVTLEPIENDIEETVDLTFAPVGADAPGKGKESHPSRWSAARSISARWRPNFSMLGIDPVSTQGRREIREPAEAATTARIPSPRSKP